MTEDKPTEQVPATPDAPVRDLDTEIRERVLARDARYGYHAYAFIYEALTFAQTLFGRDASSPDPLARHVTGQELVEGIRQYALQQFGPLAATVFRHWGVYGTADFGEIVFNLVEAGLMGKTDTDTRADFADGYDFNEAFGPAPESG